MLDPDELAEMRALQARGYGRDADLTDDDAARLSELEGRRLAGADGVPAADRPQTPDVSELRPSTSAGSGVTARSGIGPGDSAVEEPVRQTSGPAAASDRSVVRTLWRPIALAGAAALVVGVGLGWFLFGRPVHDAVALTPEQEGWQSALLAEGVYDSGSMRAIAVEEGVVVWTATKDEQKDTCLILGNGKISRPSCQPSESADDGLWGSLVVEVDAKVRREVMASVLFAPSGEAAVRVEVVDQTPGSTSITYANEKETSTAAQLAEQGFDPNSIWVAGYDGDVPIWTAIEFESQAQCLIFDGSTPTSPRVCAEPQTMTEQGSGLVLNVVDADSGKTTTFEMGSNYGPSYLVITRERGELGAGGD